MNHQIKARLEWVNLYKKTKNAGLVCRRCGISRPTLRKWWRRYQKDGFEGLKEVSRRPHSSPDRKVFDKEIKLMRETETKKTWIETNTKRVE